MSVEIKKKGYLFKQGHIRKNWLRRYWVLKSSGTFTYSEGEKAAKCKGQLELKDYGVRKTDTYSGWRRPPTDCLIQLFSKAGGKDFFLAASSEKDRDSWLAALTLVAEEARRRADGTLATPRGRVATIPLTNDEESADPQETPSPAVEPQDAPAEENVEDSKREAGGDEVLSKTQSTTFVPLRAEMVMGIEVKEVAIEESPSEPNVAKDEARGEEKAEESREERAGSGTTLSQEKRRSRARSAIEKERARAARSESSASRTGVLFVGAESNLVKMVAPALRNAAFDVSVLLLSEDSGMDEEDMSFAKVVRRSEDAAQVNAIFAGCKTMVVSATAYRSLGEEATQELLERAQDAGVGFVVLLSFMHANDSESPLGKWKTTVYDGLADMDMPAVDLRFQLFYQHVVSFIDASLFSGSDGGDEETVVAVPFEERVSFVDMRDVVNALTQILLDTTAYEDQVFTLTGPDALSLEDLGEELSHVAKRPVRLEHSCDAQTAVGAASAHAKFAEASRRLLGEMKSEKGLLFSQISDDIETLLDRSPLAFADFLAGYKP